MQDNLIFIPIKPGDGKNVPLSYLGAAFLFLCFSECFFILLFLVEQNDQYIEKVPYVLVDCGITFVAVVVGWLLILNKNLIMSLWLNLCGYLHLHELIQFLNQELLFSK